MRAQEISSSSRPMRAALVSVCVVASVLIALLIDGGRSSWSTRPFSSDYGVLSGIFLLLAAFVFLRGCRNPEWDAFSPVRFYYTLWFILLTLGCLRLTTVDLPFTWRF